MSQIHVYHEKKFRTGGMIAMADDDDEHLGGDATPGLVRSLPSNLDQEAGEISDQSSSPGEVTYQQSASSSSNVNLNNLDSVFLESRIAHGEMFHHSYPWERGYLRDIFGDSTSEVFPVVDLFDPARLSVIQQSRSNTHQAKKEAIACLQGHRGHRS